MVSVLISTVVALTLSPVMCSLILKPKDNKSPNVVFRTINNLLASGENKYGNIISRIVRNPKRVFFWFGLVLISIVMLHKIIPSSFLPVEDQGYFTVELELPENATLERSRVVADRAIDYLMTLDEVEYVQSVVGSSPRVGTSQSATSLLTH